MSFNDFAKHYLNTLEMFAENARINAEQSQDELSDWYLKGFIRAYECAIENFKICAKGYEMEVQDDISNSQ